MKKFYKKNTDENTKKNYQKKTSTKRGVSPRDNKKRPPIYKRQDDSTKTDEKIRLNRFIANAGVCSRREADDLIKAGEITVDGKVIKEMGFKVLRTDKVKHKGKVLRGEKNVYVLLNKPKDFITTTKDPQNRNTVMQLVSNACDERIFPVGRLDRNTTGLLLFTNDGELASKLMHPSYKVKKIYQVDINKPLRQEDYEQIANGLELEDGLAKVDDIAIITPDSMSVGIEIHIGKNRIVRRIFEHLGYEVIKLDRVAYSSLTKKDLNRGRWRYLSEKEVINLKHLN